MKPVFVLPVVILLFVSCAGLPTLDPVNPSLTPAVSKACASHFADGKWRLVHSIEATLPNGEKRFVIGVSLIDTPEDTIDSVIMTVEGLVIFEARYDSSGIFTRRAVPPFDSPKFARGLLNDVRLVFFEPQTESVETGIDRDNRTVCRYRNQEGSVTDIMSHAGNGWEIRQYNPNTKLSRRVVADSCRQTPQDHQQTFACRMELSTYGPAPYTLYMQLLEAESLNE